MSWSFRAIGTPENLSRALDAEAEKLDGDSRAEFEAAKPHLQGLLAMNVNPQGPCTLQLEASGHAYKKDGQVTYSTCLVAIANLGAQLV